MNTAELDMEVAAAGRTSKPGSLQLLILDFVQHVQRDLKPRFYTEAAAVLPKVVNEIMLSGGMAVTC